MNRWKLVLLASTFTLTAFSASAAEAGYDDQFEYASYAKAIDAARERLSNSKQAYDDQYEYGYAARRADMALTLRPEITLECTEVAPCIRVSNGITVRKVGTR